MLFLGHVYYLYYVLYNNIIKRASIIPENADCWIIYSYNIIKMLCNISEWYEYLPYTLYLLYYYVYYCYTRIIILIIIQNIEFRFDSLFKFGVRNIRLGGCIIWNYISNNTIVCERFITIKYMRYITTYIILQSVVKLFQYLCDFG